MRLQVRLGRPWLQLAALLQLLSVARGFFIDEHQSPSTHDWDYQNQQAWQSLHRQCGKRAQSPVDIQRPNVIGNSQLRLHFYNYEQLAKFRIQNAHHTIKLNPVEPGEPRHAHSRLLQEGRPANGSERGAGSDEEAASIDEDVELVMEQEQERRHHGRPELNNTHHDQQAAYNGTPTIKLDWLDDGNNEYKLKDIHFHWNERRDNGSEHAIDGRRAAMEMHLVHIKHGLDKSKVGFTSDSVAVIAVLIESYRKSNADFNPIVNALNHINGTTRPMDIEFKAITDLLPSSLAKFYTYSGSLTTPPCYQVVNWIVMADRLYLHAKQIEMFRNLYSPVEEAAAKLMMPNIRQLQPLNNRTILASFNTLTWREYTRASLQESSGARPTCPVWWAPLLPLALLLALTWPLTLASFDLSRSVGVRFSP